MFALIITDYPLANNRSPSEQEKSVSPPPPGAPSRASSNLNRQHEERALKFHKITLADHTEGGDNRWQVQSC